MHLMLRVQCSTTACSSLKCLHVVILISYSILSRDSFLCPKPLTGSTSWSMKKTTSQTERLHMKSELRGSLANINIISSSSMGRCCLLAAWRPSNILVYLRDWSAQTVVCAVTQKKLSRLNLPSGPVTVYWHQGYQSQCWPRSARHLAE